MTPLSIVLASALVLVVIILAGLLIKHTLQKKAKERAIQHFWVELYQVFEELYTQKFRLIYNGEPHKLVDAYEVSFMPTYLQAVRITYRASEYPCTMFELESRFVRSARETALLIAKLVALEYVMAQNLSSSR